MNAPPASEPAAPVSLPGAKVPQGGRGDWAAGAAPYQRWVCGRLQVSRKLSRDGMRLARLEVKAKARKEVGLVEFIGKLWGWVKKKR